MKRTLKTVVPFMLVMVVCLIPDAMLGQVKGKILDMSYAFGDDSVYWPTGQSFKSEKVFWGINDQGRWYASNNYSANEHGGTHVDAPIHFAQKGRTIDQIPLQEWIGPSSVL